jgi:hypothetical protein
MALSGSKDYAITRADIIEGALRKVGAYDQGEAVPGDETSAADVALNLMVKEWVARGIDIWLRDEITLFLQPDTQSYALGTANATASYVETTLSAAEASGQTVISVTSSTGMTAADNVGIKMDDDTIHWSTIASVDSGVQITIDDATDDTAASGNKVYAYTTTAGRPTKIVYAFRRDVNDIDTEVTMIGETEYRMQSNKGSAGPPVEAWYQPTMTTGTLYVWPVDGGASWDKLVLIAQYYPDDFDAASNNPQFPIEWGNVLIWNLAAELSSEYGIPEREQGRLWQIAEHKLNQLLDYDVENANVIFAVESGP